MVPDLSKHHTAFTLEVKQPKKSTWPCRRRHYDPMTHWKLFTQWHAVAFQKTSWQCCCVNLSHLPWTVWILMFLINKLYSCFCVSVSIIVFTLFLQRPCYLSTTSVYIKFTSHNVRDFHCNRPYGWRPTDDISYILCRYFLNLSVYKIWCISYLHETGS
jgi:hypothetical protein